MRSDYPAHALRRTRGPVTPSLDQAARASTRDRALIQDSLSRLYMTRGQIRIHQLATECHLSRRQYERRFKGLIGVTPKTLARVIRFEAVRDRLLSGIALRLTAVTYEFGYAHQTHFARDFKALSACSPRAFLALAALRAMTHLSYEAHPRRRYRGLTLDARGSAHGTETT